jgi:branched-chain amino acid transport system substrate-binding protein
MSKPITWALAGLAIVLVAAVGLAVALPPSHARLVGAARTRPSPAASSAPTGGPVWPTTPPVCGLHLGLMGALSGFASGLSGPMRNGAKLAVDRFTQSHPGCAVSLVEFDTGGDRGKAATVAAQAAADPQLIGVVGPLLSGESASALPVLDRTGLPMITPSATSSALSAHGWKVFHRGLPNDTAQARGAARYLRETMGAKKVYVVDDGSAYGTEAAGTVRQALGSAVVGSERVPGTNFTGTVAKLKSSGADAVYYGGYYDGAGPLLSQMRKAGVGITLVAGDGIDDPELFTLADGQYIDGTIATCSACAVITDADFLQAYGTAFNAEPTGFAATAYDVTNIFLLGLAHGAADRRAMLTFVNGYDGPGVIGRHRFAPNGEPDPAAANVDIMQIRAGQFQWVASVPAG